MADLIAARTPFSTELNDPKTRNAFFALTHAEVGGQGPQAQQAFMESVLNRASARRKSLIDAINDRAYFPAVTHQRAARGIPANMGEGYNKLLSKVLAGSNVSNFATGNASGTVGFAGGPQTYAANGERFGVEGPDRAWAQRLGFGRPPAPSDPEMPGLAVTAPPVPAATPSPTPAAPATGAAPAMTPYTGPSPDDVSQSRRMAQLLMQQGASTEPVQHWTQALARVLQGGVGGMYQAQAKQGEQQGNASIAAMLQGGATPDVSTLIQNPWTRDIGSGALKAGLVKKLAGTEFGKQGTIVQDADGNFYTAQFGSDGTRKIEPLTVGGKSPASVTTTNEFGQGTTVNRLQPSKGTRNVGGAVQDVATGRVLGNVEEALAAGKKAEAVGGAQGAHVAKFPQLEAAMSGWERQIDNTDKIIERSKTLIGKRGQMVAGYGGILANLPATDARRLRNDLETIKANIGFDKLQAMREASPTGGALGAISDMENKLLQAVQGALDQLDDPAALAASLANIQGMMRALKVEKRQAFEADKQRFGGAAQPQGAPPGQGIPAPATGGWSLKRLD